MSSTSDRSREERAFDALIVSQLRRQRDITDLGDLPQLTEEELAAMNSIPDDIIEKMWDEECQRTDEECEAAGDGDQDYALAGAGAGNDFYSGLNRAKDMAEEDKENLDESRQEAIEELEKRMKKPASGEGSDA